MKSTTAVFAFALLSACASTEGQVSVDAPQGAKAQAPAANNGPTSLSAVWMPSEFEEVTLWPKAYSGELLVMEVAEHGAEVQAGDVIATLDLVKIDRQIADAELDLASAQIKRKGLLARHQMAEESVAASLARTEADLARAQRSLRGYQEKETAFARRSDELSERREAAWLADQRDELGQLEAMYDADELVDATEEIVLNRQRRDVALTEASQALSKERRQYNVELTRKIDAEVRREGVARKEQALAHLKRTQSLESEARTDADTRSAAELAKKERRLAELKGDRASMVLTAPRSGMLLHGSARSLRSGPSAPLRKGSTLKPRAGAFVIAAPGGAALALQLPESMRSEVADGDAVTVRGMGDASWSGRLSLSAMPSAMKGDAAQFDATVYVDGVDHFVPGTHAKVELNQ